MKDTLFRNMVSKIMEDISSQSTKVEQELESSISQRLYQNMVQAEVLEDKNVMSI
jgi:G:T-mismatch repair DNA endonuclease (very short patch repair protein)